METKVTAPHRHTALQLCMVRCTATTSPHVSGPLRTAPQHQSIRMDCLVFQYHCETIWVKKLHLKL